MISFERLGGGVAVVSLRRPQKRNALSLALLSRLGEVLGEAARDASVRGVVLAGEGPSFCTGVDLAEFARGSAASVRELIGALKEVCALVRTMPKPVACAVQGHCLGGALELAACCDFRVCAPSAQLGMPEVFVGIPAVIDAVMLGQHIGLGRARELLLTGDPISGETAFAWGLASRLAPAERVVDEAVALVERVTRHAPDVIAAQKRLHEQWLELPYGQAVERSVEPLVEAFGSGLPQELAGRRLRK